MFANCYAELNLFSFATFLSVSGVYACVLVCVCVCVYVCVCVCQSYILSESTKIKISYLPGHFFFQEPRVVQEKTMYRWLGSTSADVWGLMPKHPAPCWYKSGYTVVIP